MRSLTCGVGRCYQRTEPDCSVHRLVMRIGTSRRTLARLALRPTRSTWECAGSRHQAMRGREALRAKLQCHARQPPLCPCFEGTRRPRVLPRIALLLCRADATYSAPLCGTLVPSASMSSESSASDCGGRDLLPSRSPCVAIHLLASLRFFVKPYLSPGRLLALPRKARYLASERPSYSKRFFLSSRHGQKGIRKVS